MGIHTFMGFFFAKDLHIKWEPNLVLFLYQDSFCVLALIRDNTKFNSIVVMFGIYQLSLRQKCQAQRGDDKICSSPNSIRKTFLSTIIIQQVIHQVLNKIKPTNLGFSNLRTYIWNLNINEKIVQNVLSHYVSKLQYMMYFIFIVNMLIFYIVTNFAWLCHVVFFKF